MRYDLTESYEKAGYLATRSRGRAGTSGGSRRTYVIVGLIAGVFLLGFIALVVIDMRQRAASSPPANVESVDVGSGGQHTEGAVEYAQNPPAGGEHNPTWQNCGFYDEPIRNETAVHSLEHGAVWITYSPDLPQGQVGTLRDLAQGQSHVLVSPYPDLPSPVVASSWGKQARFESADDPDLDRFIRAYRQGPDTPEPGGVCIGGVGEPVQ